MVAPLLSLSSPYLHHLHHHPLLLFRRMTSSSTRESRVRALRGDRPVKALILDITGVLYNSMEGTDGIPIKGSPEAVQRLYDTSNVRFLSNESTGTVEHVVAKLGRLGYKINPEHVITPAPTAAAYCASRGLRPYLLVHPGIVSVFKGLDQSNPNCVLMGDMEHAFTFQAINTAFRHLMRLQNEALLISLGCGKFYQRTDGPTIDVGAFAEALKYSSGITSERHVVIGKPNASYFQTALDSLGGMDKEEVVMVGDDIISDIGGAQAFGMRAIQVRTGKWRSEWESHPTVRPSFIADDLADAVSACLD